MTTEEALALLGLDWPRSNKLSCPKVSDSNPSLHLYRDDKGYYCFTCNEGGDAISLISHYTGQPPGEIMREQGIKIGPRGRSRWQQIDDLQARARDLTLDFTFKVWALWGRREGMQYVRSHAERVDYLFDGLFGVDDETLPFELHQAVKDLERYYESELSRLTQGKHTLVTRMREFQRSALRGSVSHDGRRQRTGAGNRIPRQGGTVRLVEASRPDGSDGSGHPSST